MAQLTFNPDPHVESTSVDGYVRRQGVNETWSTIYNGAGADSEDSTDDTRIAQIECSATTNQFGSLCRGIFLFDTSSIPDEATITSATFSLYLTAVTDQLAQKLGITSSDPVSDTAIANGDYAIAKFGSTKFATDIDLTDLNTGQYNDFALNASGLAAISKTGITKFAARISGDIENTAPTWATGETARVAGRYADFTGTDNDPKLVVNYTIPSGFLALL